MKKIKKALVNPRLILLYLMKYKPFRALSDKRFIQLEYYLKMNEKVNLKKPKTFSGKLQLLKLYDRNPIYTKLVDKYEVRKIIENKLGKDYLIPLYGVYNNYEEINFEELPNQFVLKPTHTSGNVYICKDKSKINHSKLKKTISEWLNREYYWVHREWPYKNVKPRIICEKYMIDESNKGLNDYKFYCFNGNPKALFIATERGENVKFDFYDLHFNHLPIGLRNSDKQLIKPSSFEKMSNIASLLSKEIPFVRIDLYNINGKIYFGEFTFFSDAGFERFDPNHKKYDNLFGEWLDIQI